MLALHSAARANIYSSLWQARYGKKCDIESFFALKIFAIAETGIYSLPRFDHCRRLPFGYSAGEAMLQPEKALATGPQSKPQLWNSFEVLDDLVMGAGTALNAVGMQEHWLDFIDGLLDRASDPLDMQLAPPSITKIPKAAPTTLNLRQFHSIQHKVITNQHKVIPKTAFSTVISY